MADAKAPAALPRLTAQQWLICFIAVVGFSFDIYEILMLPLIVRPALLELTGAVPGSPEFQMWVGRLFYIPAFAGGIFGLLGGYLTDRLGRRRVSFQEPGARRERSGFVPRFALPPEGTIDPAQRARL